MEFGYFSEPIDLQLLADGKRMKLLCEVIYTDPQGKAWTAPKDFVSDGASIPRAFWSVVGGPWDGAYRNAAIVHAQYCDTESEPSHAVHRMFYFACRAAGVGEIKAKVLYAAVRIGGPRWGEDTRLPEPSGPITLDEMVLRDTIPEPSATRMDAAAVAKWVEQSNPSLQEIDSLASG